MGEKLEKKVLENFLDNIIYNVTMKYRWKMTNKTKEIRDIVFSSLVGLAAGVSIFYWFIYSLILLKS